MSTTIIGLYKAWYIATAFVCIIALPLLSIRVLKPQRVVRSTGLLLIYYVYLLMTAIWAEYPGNTTYYVSIELIFPVIFALFYLLSSNFEIDRIIDFFVYMVPPAIISFCLGIMVDPQATRLGGRMLDLLPFAFLFTVLRLINSYSIWNIVSVAACLAMLVVSMSRTPLMISGLGVFLMFLTITKQWKTRRRLIIAFATVCVIAAISILAIPKLKLDAARAISRITYQDVSVDGHVIESEMPDLIRWRIYDDAISLYSAHWLLGMGYMNFMPWFGDTYSFAGETAGGKEVVGMNLHNVYQTWALEGGVPCMIIVFLLLRKYFRILRKRIRQSDNDTEKSYYKLLIISMICLLVDGAFHQIHQMPPFFMFLGIVYALDNKHKKKKPTTSTITNR